MILLGIDPGLVQTGYGLIKIKNNTKNILDYGTISPKKSDSLAQRLNTIHEDISYIIKKHKLVFDKNLNKFGIGEDQLRCC